MSKQLPHSVWLKKGWSENWWQNLLIGNLPKEDWVKKLKDVTWNTSYLIEDRQTYFRHVSRKFYYFIFSGKMKIRIKWLHHKTFHNTLVFLCSEKSDCMGVNIHLEKYVESMLNI